MQFKGARKLLPEIARELNVDAIVEGSVIRSEGRVKITAQLIRGATDQHLWADSYERELRDVLALQSEVARGIAGQIKIKLTPQEQARLTNTRPINPDAQEAYLKAVYYFNEGLNTDNELQTGLAKGRELREKSIELRSEERRVGKEC